MDQVSISRELLRQVIEALTHGCPPDCKNGMTDSGGTHPWGEPVLIPCPSCTTLTALRTALEQPAAEPVAWLRKDGMKSMPEIEKAAWIDAERPDLVEEYTVPLFTAPQAQKEKP